MNYTLKSFNTGQITLPKKWRDQAGTTHFIAEERPDGLLVRPIKIEKTTEVYYENEEGFGVYYPSGMNPESLISQIQALQNGSNN